MRYDVKGEIQTGDDAWSILTAIGNVLAGDEEETPGNMVSKGGGESLAVPAAIHGANLIAKGDRKLWLAWKGGEAPFTVSIKQGGAIAALPAVTSRTADVPVAVHEGEKLSISIADAKGQVSTVRIRAHDGLPIAPAAIRSAAPGDSAQALVEATWLMSQDGGAWGIEAIQELHSNAAKDQAASALLKRILAGWRP